MYSCPAQLKTPKILWAISFNLDSEPDAGISLSWGFHLFDSLTTLGGKAFPQEVHPVLPANGCETSIIIWRKKMFAKENSPDQRHRPVLHNQTCTLSHSRRSPFQNQSIQCGLGNPPLPSGAIASFMAFFIRVISVSWLMIIYYITCTSCCRGSEDTPREIQSSPQIHCISPDSRSYGSACQYLTR